MKYGFCFLLLVCGIPLSLLAVEHQSDAIAQFKSSLQGKVFTLKNFYKSDQLEFDETGHFLGQPEVGSWTVYSKLLINSVQFDSSSLKLSATRMAVRFNINGEPELLPLDRAVTLQIALPNGPLDPRILTSALGCLFISADEKFSGYVPDYWRPIMTALEEPEKHASNLDPDQLGSNASSATYPPSLLHATDVAYTDAARSQNFQGELSLVADVAKDGRVSQVWLLRPAGLGLDDEAISQVRKWTFKPATQNGKPVAVPLHVELAFRLIVVN